MAGRKFKLELSTSVSETEALLILKDKLMKLVGNKSVEGEIKDILLDYEFTEGLLIFELDEDSIKKESEFLNSQIRSFSEETDYKNKKYEPVGNTCTIYKKDKTSDKYEVESSGKPKDYAMTRVNQLKAQGYDAYFENSRSFSDEDDKMKIVEDFLNFLKDKKKIDIHHDSLLENSELVSKLSTLKNGVLTENYEDREIPTKISALIRKIYPESLKAKGTREEFKKEMDRLRTNYRNSTKTKNFSSPVSRLNKIDQYFLHTCKDRSKVTKWEDRVDSVMDGRSTFDKLGELEIETLLDYGNNLDSETKNFSGRHYGIVSMTPNGEVLYMEDISLGETVSVTSDWESKGHSDIGIFESREDMKLIIDKLTPKTKGFSMDVYSKEEALDVLIPYLDKDSKLEADIQKLKKGIRTSETYESLEIAMGLIDPDSQLYKSLTKYYL